MVTAIENPLTKRYRIGAALLLTGILLIISISLGSELAAQSGLDSNTGTNLGIAKHSDVGMLEKPFDMDRWIHMGSNLGQGYKGEKFAVDDPGTFRVVTMEPTAYDYFLQHGEYADGTMFALSVFKVASKVEPDLNGYSQGSLLEFEIHLIDSKLNKDGRQFYIFAKDGESAMPLANQSVCVNCHKDEARFQSTFTQFYPNLGK